jgi:hypothetical protein
VRSSTLTTATHAARSTRLVCSGRGVSSRGTPFSGTDVNGALRPSRQQGNAVAIPPMWLVRGVSRGHLRARHVAAAELMSRRATGELPLRRSRTYGWQETGSGECHGR